MSGLRLMNNSHELSVKEQRLRELIELARLRKLHQDREPEAELLLREALTIDGWSGRAHYHLGFLAQQRGEDEEAENHFAKAIDSLDLEPLYQAKAHAYLAVVCYAQDRFEDAETWWAEALARKATFRREGLPWENDAMDMGKRSRSDCIRRRANASATRAQAERMQTESVDVDDPGSWRSVVMLQAVDGQPGYSESLITADECYQLTANMGWRQLVPDVSFVLDLRVENGKGSWLSEAGEQVFSHQHSATILRVLLDQRERGVSYRDLDEPRMSTENQFKPYIRRLRKDVSGMFNKEPRELIMNIPRRADGLSRYVWTGPKSYLIFKTRSE
jgi:tetratricopeptide (TPR) repeat protein